MEKVKVKSVVDTGRTWASPQGKTFKISNVTLDDGRTGETMSEKFKAGEEASIIVAEKEWQGKKTLSFKFVPADGGGFMAKGGARSGNESFALSYAKDVYIAHLNSVGKELRTSDMFAVADKMFEWLNSKKQ